MQSSIARAGKLATTAGLLCLFALGVVAGIYCPVPSWLNKGRPSAQPDDATAAAPAAGHDERLGPRPRFVDVAAESGVSFRHHNGMTGRCQYLEIMGAGAALFDYDDDGDLDIYFVNGGRLDGQPDPQMTNRLYRNDGNWRFHDLTAEAGVAGRGYGQGCTTGDYDRDGDLDLYVTNYGPNILYRNNGDGTFSDVASAAGVADEGWGQGACFFDYDDDDDLDLYVQNYLAVGSTENVTVLVPAGARQVPDYPSPLGLQGSASRLYQNQTDGTFRDVTEEAGVLRADGKGMGLAAVDFSGDRLVDLFIANDTMENYLFRGLGGGRFEEIGRQAGVAYDAAGTPEASMGVDVADYDHDGDWDLVVPCLARQVFTLYRNDKTQFMDVSASAGLARSTSRATGFDAHFWDYDNDGDLDLVFTCGGVRRNENAPPEGSYNDCYGMPDILLAGDGAGRFIDVSRQAGDYFQRALIGRGSAVGDLDNDGDLDLVISNLADQAAVLRNDTRGGHWLTLDLADRQGRRNPDGVSVWITAGGRRQHAATHPATTYLSQSDRRVHFGLGKTGTIERIDVSWPDGGQQALENVVADQFLKVVQPAGR